MVWPFLSLYLRQRLPVPLTLITLLLSWNGAVGLVTTAVAGGVVDRFGRKRAMVLSLLGSGLSMLTMIPTGSLGLWFLLRRAMGGFGPIFRVGGDAMVADLIEPARRAEAYALLRMAVNLGVVIGPSVGGFMASASYPLAIALQCPVALRAAGAVLRCRDTAIDLTRWRRSARCWGL